MIIQLPTPILLNKLYQPICRKGRPSIIKNKSAKEYGRIVKILCIKQGVELIKGKVSVHIDILIKDRRDFDIDGILKVILDVLQKVAYSDDKHILELIVRKHLEAEKDGLVIEINKINL